MISRSGNCFASSRLVYTHAYMYYYHQCCLNCAGTPRQGHLAPASRAVIKLRRSGISPASLEGLEKFSHVWVFFVFHLNNNAKWSRGHTKSDRGNFTFPAKISPPFLKKKVRSNSNAFNTAQHSLLSAYFKSVYCAQTVALLGSSLFRMRAASYVRIYTSNFPLKKNHCTELARHSVDRWQPLAHRLDCLLQGHRTALTT
jgi:tRNA-methyltransferase O